MILALETSSAQSSIALLSSSTKVVAEKHFTKGQEYSEPTTEALQEILSSQKMTLHNVDRIAVGLGPGRFTGVRIGINIARSLAFAMNKIVVGIDSLRVLSASADTPGKSVWTVVNAHKNMVFVSNFVDSKCLLQPTAWAIEEVAKNIPAGSVVVGDALLVYKKVLPLDWTSKITSLEKVMFPQASALGRLAFSEGQVFQPDQWKNINPLYVRDSEAEENLRKGLLKPLLKL